MNEVYMNLIIIAIPVLFSDMTLINDDCDAA